MEQFFTIHSSLNAGCGRVLYQDITHQRGYRNEPAIWWRSYFIICSEERCELEEWLENHSTLWPNSKPQTCLLGIAIIIAALMLVDSCKLKIRIAPHLFWAQIRKRNVDHFCGDQMIPRCELLLRWPHTDKPHVCLEHRIDLIGAKGRSFLTLYIPGAGEWYIKLTVSKKFTLKIIFVAITMRPTEFKFSLNLQVERL